MDMISLSSYVTEGILYLGRTIGEAQYYNYTQQNFHRFKFF
jgi:hypothetical protein